MQFIKRLAQGYWKVFMNRVSIANYKNAGLLIDAGYLCR